MNEEIENVIRKSIRLDMAYYIRKYARTQGIEGVEDAIKRVYGDTPKLLKEYLAVYRTLLKNGSIE